MRQAPRLAQVLPLSGAVPTHLPSDKATRIIGPLGSIVARSPTANGDAQTIQLAIPVPSGFTTMDSYVYRAVPPGSRAWLCAWPSWRAWSDPPPFSIPAASLASGNKFFAA